MLHELESLGEGAGYKIHSGMARVTLGHGISNGQEVEVDLLVHYALLKLLLLVILDMRAAAAAKALTCD